MRFVIVALLCAGCPVEGSNCNVDNECAQAQVCARDHVCVAPDKVRATLTTWSFMDGIPADMDTCVFGTVGKTQPLELQIIFAMSENRDDEDKLGFAPVPCFVAQFTVDKLPTRYTHVRLNQDGGEPLAEGVFDPEGLAALELRMP